MKNIRNTFDVYNKNLINYMQSINTFLILYSICSLQNHHLNPSKRIYIFFVLIKATIPMLSCQAKRQALYIFGGNNINNNHRNHYKYTYFSIHLQLQPKLFSLVRTKFFYFLFIFMKYHWLSLHPRLPNMINLNSLHFLFIEDCCTHPPFDLLISSIHSIFHILCSLEGKISLNNI